MPADPPSPKPVVDKLGARPDQRWVLLGDGLDGLEDDLRTRHVRTSRRQWGAADGVVYRAAEKPDLDKLSQLRDLVAPAGAVWVFWRKGRPELREDDVRAAAAAQGLVDVKVIAVSAELSGLKLVIPVRQRARRPPIG